MSPLETGVDGAFSGYASVFGKPDLARDIVMPGAFAASLSRRKADQVRMLFQHDPAEPLGVWCDLREDHHGLYCCGLLNLDVQRAREMYALMRQGAIDGLSIGFKTLRARRDITGGGRQLTRIDLWEISLVSFPLLPEARVHSVKTAPAGNGLAGHDALLTRARNFFPPRPERI